MITDKYLQCLKELQQNPNIEIGKYSETNYHDCEPPSERFLERRKRKLEEENFLIFDKDLEYFNLSSIVLNWDSLLSLGDVVIRGGFVFNGITDALILPTDYFKKVTNIKDDGDYSQQLGWFERLPMGVDVYPNNISVGVVNGELKIITERNLNSEKRRNEEIIEWIYKERSNVYKEDITIKKEGTLVETLRVFEPEHPTWLADYNNG